MSLVALSFSLHREPHSENVIEIVPENVAVDSVSKSARVSHDNSSVSKPYFWGNVRFAC